MSFIFDLVYDSCMSGCNLAIYKDAFCNPIRGSIRASAWLQKRSFLSWLAIVLNINLI